MEEEETCLVYHVTSTYKEFLLWCLDKDNETLCIRVPAQLEAYIEVLTVNDKGNITEDSENAIVNPEITLNKFLAINKTSQKKLDITGCETVHKKEIYFYNGDDTKPYIKVNFSSLIGYNRFKNLFFSESDGLPRRANVVIDANFTVRLRMLESDIPPLWQFLYRFNFRPCSTIYVPSSSNICVAGLTLSKCPREFTTPSITPCTSTELPVFPLIFSFDIEAQSSNPSMFPNPDNLLDVVFFIGIYIKRYRSAPETARKIGLYLVNKDVVLGDDGTNEGELLFFEREEDLLAKFFDLICEIQPQIVLSYNGLGFDIKYIDRRMSIHQLKYPNFSLVDNQHVSGDIHVLSTNWSSSAYKAVSCYYFDLPGVVFMDMFFEIKRNYSLKSYTLQEASQFFLKESKVDLKAKEMFKIYSNYLEGNPNRELLRRIAEYGIQDAILPTRLFDHLYQWTTYTQMCKVMNIQLIDLIARGQTIRTKSNIYRVARDRNMIINIPRNKPIFKGKFKGAFVGDMQSGLHDNVLVIDFASLYPSIMASMNLCYTTFIHPRDWSKYKIGEYNEFLVDIPFKKEKVPVRYIKPDIYKGIIPSVVEGFLSARKKEKELAELSTTPDQKIIHDKAQLAIKTSGNSIYGSLAGFGDQDGRDVDSESGSQLSLKWISMTVTSVGQILIRECNKFIETKYGGTILYNDTDSVFFTIPNIKPEKLTEIGCKIADEFSADLPKPLKIEFEKAIRMIGLTPKRYTYRCYDKDGNLKPIINFKGVVSVRRDTCIWQSNVFTKVSEGILAGLSKQEITKIIYEAIVALLDGNVPYKKLLIGGSIGETYKSSTATMAILKSKAQEAGRPLAAGSRIEYIIRDTGYVGPKTKAPKLGERIVLVDDIDPVTTKIDYVYYIVHKLRNPVDQLYEKVFHGDRVIEHLVPRLLSDPDEVKEELKEYLFEENDEIKEEDDEEDREDIEDSDNDE